MEECVTYSRSVADGDGILEAFGSAFRVHLTQLRPQAGDRQPCSATGRNDLDVPGDPVRPALAGDGDHGRRRQALSTGVHWSRSRHCAGRIVPGGTRRLVLGLLGRADLAAALDLARFRNRRALAKAKVRRVVILGLDGLDPDLVEELLERGGTAISLGSRSRAATRGSRPPGRPLSPVAWSSFSTGTNPGKHNIFDFISRNKATYGPMMSSVQIGKPGRTLKLGQFLIPLSSAPITGLRKSKPFWNVLGRGGNLSARSCACRSRFLRIVSVACSCRRCAFPTSAAPRGRFASSANPRGTSGDGRRSGRRRRRARGGLAQRQLRHGRVARTDQPAAHRRGRNQAAFQGRSRPR